MHSMRQPSIVTIDEDDGDLSDCMLEARISLLMGDVGTSMFGVRAYTKDQGKHVKA